MGDIVQTVGFGEEQQVAGQQGILGHLLAVFVVPLIGGSAADVLVAIMGVNVPDKAGAVETGGGVFATPDVVVAHILQGKFHQRIRLRPAVGIHGVLHPSLKGQVRSEEHSQGLLALGAALGKQLLAVTLDDPQLHQKAGAGEGVAAQLSGVGEVVEAGAGAVFIRIATDGQEVNGDFEKLLPGDWDVRPEGAVGKAADEAQVVGLGDDGVVCVGKGTFFYPENGIGIEGQVGLHGYVTHLSPGNGGGHIPA